MINTMKNIFRYNGYSFNIIIDIDYQDDTLDSSKKYYKICINNIGISDWELIDIIEFSSLLSTIDIFKEKAIEYVDNRDNRPIDVKILSDLGFE